MSDAKIHVTMPAKDVVESAVKFQNELAKITKSAIGPVNAFLQLGATADETSAHMVYMSKKGIEITKTFKYIDGAVKETESSFKTFGVKSQKAINTLTNGVKKFLAQQTQFKTDGATLKQNYVDAFGQIQSAIAKTALDEKISLNKVKQITEDFNLGKVRAYTAAEAKIRALLVQRKNLEQQIVGETNTRVQEAMTRAEAGTTKTMLGGVGPKTFGASATQQQVSALTMAKQAVIDFQIQNKVSAADIAMVWKNIVDGKIVEYPSRLIAVDAQLRKVKSSVDSLSMSEEKRLLIQKQMTQAITAQSAITKLTKISTTEGASQEAINSVIQHRQQLVSLQNQYKFTRSTILKVWRDSKDGVNKEYTPELMKLRQQIDATRAAHIKLRAETMKKISIKSAIPMADMSKATPAAALAYTEAYKKVEVIANKHKLTLAQIRTLWTDISRNKIRAYTGGMGEAQKAAVALKTSQGKLITQQSTLNKKVKEYTLSWRSMVRLVAVQLSHQAISKLVRTLKDGVLVAIELQKKIYEIRTIQGSGIDAKSTEEWIVQLRKLSDAFGIDILKQAEALYQTMSNQIAKGAEALQFLTIANNLALVSLTTTEIAVESLTGVLNAYKMTVSESSEVSAKLFKIVELGRIRLEQLADIGNVAILAAQLGVSFEEVGAMLATVTVQGMATREAMTQIRGIMIELLKPTAHMKKLYKELGVASGEAAIEAYGFSGLMDIISEKTQGSSTQLAKYINRIRGISGAMAIAGKNADLYKSNLEKIMRANLDFADKTEIAMENSGKKLEITLTRLSNYFKVELGNSFLNFVEKITDGFKGLYVGIMTVLAGVKMLIMTLGGVGIAVTIRYFIRTIKAVWALTEAKKALIVANLMVVKTEKQIAAAAAATATAKAAISAGQLGIIALIAAAAIGAYMVISYFRAKAAEEERLRQLGLKALMEQTNRYILESFQATLIATQELLKRAQSDYAYILSQTSKVFFRVQDEIKKMFELTETVFKNFKAVIDAGYSSLSENIVAKLKTVDSVIKLLESRIERYQSKITAAAIATQRASFRMKIDAASAKELKNVEDRIDAAKIAFDEAKETFGADSPQAEVSKTNIKDLEAERKGILKKQHAERMAKYTTEYDEQKENYNKQLDLLDKTDREIQKATEAGDAITIQSLQKRREAEEKELTAISKYIMTLLEKQHTLAEGSEKAAIEKITDMKKAAEEQFNAWSLARAERTRKTLVDIQKNMLAEQAKNALAFQQLNLVLEKRTEVERLRKEAFESKEADPKKRFALIEKARQASVELYDKLEKVTGGFSKEFREKLDIENIFDLKRQRKDIEASFDALVDKLKVDLKAKFGAEVSGELEGRLKKLQDEVKAVSDSAESIKEAAFGEDLSIEQPSIWEHLVLNSKELKGLITDIKSQILTSMDLDLGGTIGTVGDYQKLAKEDAKKYQSTVKLIQKTTSQLSKHQTALAELKAKEVKEGLSQPERDRQGKLKTAIGHEINIRNILVKRLSEEAKTKATNLDKFVDAILKSGDLNKFKSNEFKSYFAGTPLQDYGTRLAENVQTILELREKLLGATSSAERAEIVAEATKKIIELQTQIKSLGEEPREKTAEEKASERLSAMSPKELVDAIRDNRLDLATFGDSFKITERLLADGNIERTKIVEALDLLVTNWKNPAAAAAGEESIMGGMVLAANGQYMHGRDDIPALLSRGEFVMNAPATRQFFGSIQAMNSAGRNSSVASNITNVGDVNVSLMSSGGETIDAVRIGKAISKEIRRGRL